MDTFIIVATFKPGTDMAEVMAVLREEQAQVGLLRDEGRMGAIHLSMARGTIFLETLAEDEAAAVATVHTLPMSRWWDLDVFPTSAPVEP